MIELAQRWLPTTPSPVMDDAVLKRIPFLFIVCKEAPPTLFIEGAKTVQL